MRREELDELHYITPIQNVPSVLQRGLLSHRKAASVPHISVAMEVIQERRRHVIVPGGRRLHDYVNLYVNARNKMMFKVKSDHGVDDLCVLKVATNVIDLPGAVVADRNASSDYVRFDPAPEGVRRLDRETIFARYWNHPDPIEKQRHGSLMCAEVLIPDQVPPTFVIGAYVATSQAQTSLQALSPSLPIEVKPYLFFR
jgi:ssDNA thymidine ADP-ribosyltransferase, DarT